MPRYEVYATRWDNPHIIDEVIPAQGLSFSMPLSDHGQASFTVAVEPGRSSWRAAITPPVSGILIARDGVPVWQGWVTDEKEGSGRTFSFTAKEWGAFFTHVPAVPHTYTQVDNHDTLRSVLTLATAVAGQDPKITAPLDTTGHAVDLTIPAWDTRTVEAVLQELANREDGLEWYFGTTGPLDNPQRLLVLGNVLGQTTAETVLEYVEETARGERGGNVITKARTRNTANAATASIAVDGGAEAAQVRKTAQAATLLTAGWPRMTTTTSYSDPMTGTTLQGHANADLAAVAGVATGYALTTADDWPDWTDVPRGSQVRVVLDTDVYGGTRPVAFTARLLNLTVSVADDGPALVQWDTADRLEAT